jgi:hypothetical protein
VAESPEDLEAVYRLRYLEVIERGWAEPNDFPDGLEQDIYDERAIQIAGWYGNTLAATIRLVLPNSNHLLPTETAFDLRFEPCGKVIEVGRTIVAPMHRGSRQHRVLFGLLGKMGLEMQACGFSEVCGTMSEPVINLYRKIGVEVAVLGAARQYWNEARYPCRYNMFTSAITIGQQLVKSVSRS